MYSEAIFRLLIKRKDRDFSDIYRVCKRKSNWLMLGFLSCNGYSVVKVIALRNGILQTQSEIHSNISVRNRQARELYIAIRNN